MDAHMDIHVAGVRLEDTVEYPASARAPELLATI